MQTVLTRKQLKKRNSEILKWLNKLVDSKERKDLLGPIRLAYKPFGTEAGDTLYLTKTGLIDEHWSRKHDMFDNASTDRYESKIYKKGFKEIIEEYGEKLELKTLREVFAELIA